MTARVSRRDALKAIGSAGAVLTLGGRAELFQGEAIRVAGAAATIAVRAVSASTVRITVTALTATGVPDDGALVPMTTLRPIAGAKEPGGVSAVGAGRLTVRVTPNPPVLTVSADGNPFQQLRLNAEEPGMSFLLPRSPLLGMGEGGPQFDRKGSTDPMRSGQGGYHLRTHGGRVPIQWLVGTDGWGMYIHQPLGSFDLTGTEGRFLPGAAALPLDVFVTASSDPGTLLSEYARITGHAELPPQWAFGYMQSHRTLAGPPHRALRVSGCTGKGRSSGGPTSARSRCTGMATPACSATVRF